MVFQCTIIVCIPSCVGIDYAALKVTKQVTKAKTDKNINWCHILLILLIYKKCEFLSQDQGSVARKPLPVQETHTECASIYYELVGIPIRYAATYYFRRFISVSLLRFRSREIIVCLVI